MGAGSSYNYSGVPLTAEASGLALVAPAATSWGADRLDVFAVSNPRELFGPRELVHAWWQGDPNRPSDTAWSLRGNPSRWRSESLGGRLWDVRPSAVSWGRGRWDAFAVSDATALQHWWLGPAPQRNWAYEQVAGPRLRNGTGPAAVSWGAGRLDVFAIIEDGSLEHWWQHQGNPWRSENLGGRLAPVDLAAVSWAPGHLDVLAVDTGGRLLCWTYNQDSPRLPFQRPPAEIQPGVQGRGVAATAWGRDRLDVVDTSLQHFWYQGAWGTPDRGLPGFDPAARPAIVDQGPGRLWAFSVKSPARVFGPRRLAVLSYDQRQANPWRLEEEESWLSAGGVGAVATRGSGRVDAFAVSDSNLVSGASAQLQYFWIDPAYSRPVVTIDTPSPLPPAVPDIPYSHQLLASGFPATVSPRWRTTSGQLPRGLTLSESGLISGTVAARDWGSSGGSGLFTADVQGGYPPGHAAKVLRLPVAVPPPADTRTYITFVLSDPDHVVDGTGPASVEVVAAGVRLPTAPLVRTGGQTFEATLGRSEGGPGLWSFTYRVGLITSRVYSYTWHSGRVLVYVWIRRPDLDEHPLAYFELERIVG